METKVPVHVFIIQKVRRAFNNLRKDLNISISFHYTCAETRATNIYVSSFAPQTILARKRTFDCDIFLTSKHELFGVRSYSIGSESVTITIGIDDGHDVPIYNFFGT